MTRLQHQLHTKQPGLLKEGMRPNRNNNSAQGISRRANNTAIPVYHHKYKDSVCSTTKTLSRDMYTSYIIYLKPPFFLHHRHRPTKKTGSFSVHLSIPSPMRAPLAHNAKKTGSSTPPQTPFPNFLGQPTASNTAVKLPPTDSLTPHRRPPRNHNSVTSTRKYRHRHQKVSTPPRLTAKTPPTPITFNTPIKHP